tara:strand:- start:3423 stop:3752 length:330 start_codon:yes stop_codon:yes gene_type:complete
VTRSDARDLERQLKDQIKERAAQFDPLLAEQLKSGGALVKGYGGGKAEAAGAEAAAGAGAGGDAGEVRARPFEARIEASRLDGARPPAPGTARVPAALCVSGRPYLLTY